jgi:hypothetical protein
MKITRTLLENLTTKQRWQLLTERANPEKLNRFMEYHSENRKVYDFMEQLAEEAWEKDVPKISHWLLLNRVRWEFGVATYDASSPFKISNDYFAFYARLLIAKRPKFIDMLTIKEMKKS